MIGFYEKCFYNGPDTLSRSQAIIQNFIDGNPDCPLYIITSVDKRKVQYWEALLETLGLNLNVTVDSWYRLSHYEDVTAAHFIFDGDQIYSRAKWTRSFFKIVKKNNSWVAAADYNDRWIDYMPLFVACGFYKNNTDFQRDHVKFNCHMRYPVIDSYVNVNKLRDNLDKIRILPPFQKGSDNN